jgi:tetratricopeptide (TPR) repeat protein
LRALSSAARRLAAVGDAVAWCERAVHLDRKADPGSPKSLIMLGCALRDVGDPPRAAQVWQAALEIGPANLDLHIDLADLAFSRRDHAASRRWAERAVDLNRSSRPVERFWRRGRARQFRTDEWATPWRWPIWSSAL